MPETCREAYQLSTQDCQLPSRLDGFQVFELAAFCFENHCRFGGVAIFVDGDFSRDGLKIFCRGDGIAEFWSVSRPSTPDGVGEDERRIIPKRRHRIRCVSLPAFA